jgi:RNA polymerase sigma-70 factor (ECF subfamily)
LVALPPFRRRGPKAETPAPVAIDDAALDDAALVTRFCEDSEAFAALYDRHFAGVYAYCYRKLRNQERAEDAAHLVFVRALESLARYRETGKFQQWLYTIAHNVIVSELGSRRPQTPLDDVPDIPGDGDSVEQATVSALDHEALWEAITRLPDDQRRAIELRIAGRTGAEIAVLMGRSHEAVRMLQQRAMTRLRSDLAGPDRKGARR